MSEVHDATYYGKCMIGGIFACGLTHMAVCPSISSSAAPR